MACERLCGYSSRGPSQITYRAFADVFGLEAKGSMRYRIALIVPDGAADNADSAREVAKREVEERLTLLLRIGECNATRLDTEPYA